MRNDYYIDDQPTTWRDLIRFAASLDGDFAVLDIKTTSEAADILRDHGHTVSEPPPEPPND